MNAILESMGVKVENLPSHHVADYPKPVSGRVAHIDADFIAYMAAADTVDEIQGVKPRKTLEEKKEKADSILDHQRRMVGAEHMKVHITPPGSTKGDRPAQAIQQEYQAVRKTSERPEHLDALRHHLGTKPESVVHLEQEADDGMAQANYSSMGPDGSWQKSNLSVIVSKDKDLRMVPGLHWDWDNECVHCVGDPFGTLYWYGEGKSKKLRGWGTKWFWAQCLMGDTVDNIRGLPAVPGSIHTELTPTKTFKDTYNKWADEENPEKAAKLKAKLDEMTSKTKPVGPVAAYAILQNATTDKVCFILVREAFQRLEAEHGHEFRHWRTGERVTPTQALLGDMQLLWMRRKEHAPLDVVEWLKEKTNA